ncbi:Alcohol dehydrogenase [Pseudomonas sp. IT-P74]|jgi:hypothetical protein|uniref:Uncharacterized protein n=1 Tax=Pseudomonas fluorescens TaxID=294 RepID=A0A5E7VM32_PSEFL|nr:hypothetical protein PS938_05473 [Pseudomonas fluorescens]
MHKYTLSYEHINTPKTKTGQAPERIDAHELLLELLGVGGKDGPIIFGTKSLQESLELMKFKNVRVTWL